MKNLTEKIIAAIETRQVEQIPRWQFVTREWLLKILFIISTLNGALAVSISWSILLYLNEGIAEHLVEIVPFVWIGALCLMLCVMFYNLRKLQRGYRYASWKIISFNIFLSLVLGGLLFFGGFGKLLHTYFYEHLPLYENIVNAKSAWVYPEKGLLSGTITSIKDGSFTLQDLDQILWTVTITPDTTQEKGVGIVVGTRVKIVGIMKDPKNFEAHILRSW
jgi:hypothetical protein